MRLHILSQDESYMDCIENGHHVPVVTITGVAAVDGKNGLDRIVPKDPANYFVEDSKEVNKDKEAMNILYNELILICLKVLSTVILQRSLGYNSIII